MTMKPPDLVLGCFIVALIAGSLSAQTPTISSIEAPYAAMQSQVTVAGGTYGPGAVAYGPVGTSLVLTGSNLGTSGIVFFTSYKNRAVDQNVAPVAATVTIWTSTILTLTVPSGAFTGKVSVVTSGGTSNSLPFIVMPPRSYTGSCPILPDDSQFQIVTSSLQDGTVGQAYSVPLEATGGSPPYTWSLTGSALPAGLSLSSTGVISGTPTSAGGPVSVAIQAMDQNRLVTQALLNLTIDSSVMNTGTIYSYSAAYDGASNVTSYNDSVMGAWSFGYDSLNRLATGGATSGDFDSWNMCWNYDSFGNRQQQEVSSATFLSGSGGANACQAQSTATLTADISTYNGNNQITGTNARGVTAIPGYDAAGDMTSDGINTYLYDAEGRVCAVQSTPISGSTTMTGYLYNAEGIRVAKGPITTMSCDPVTSHFQVSGATTTYYALGSRGEGVSTFDGNNNWQRSNVYGGGSLLATYDTAGLHFHLTDPLGTRRVQTNSTGFAETDCQSLPFGDQQNCFPDPNSPNTADDATPLHFTGKERDTESGNDYFGARYYASSMGRFMSPDPAVFSAANPSYPQTWNLYAYAANNPLRYTDPTGLDCVYYNDAGDKVESIDHHSDSGECKDNGGNWEEGTTYKSWQHYDKNSDTWNGASIDSKNVYFYQGDAPQANYQFNGQWQNPCNGNCLYDSNSTSISNLQGQLQNGATVYGLLNWAVSQGPSGGSNANSNGTWHFLINGYTQWCGPGGAGVPASGNDWGCLAHDYNYHVAGFNYFWDQFNGNLPNGQNLQRINQTLCDSVSGSGAGEIRTTFAWLGVWTCK
jgi:RHS repeat-associated protein